MDSIEARWGTGDVISMFLQSEPGVRRAGACRPVRDLTLGSGIEFADRGRHELKGVPGEWQVLAVASS